MAVQISPPKSVRPLPGLRGEEVGFGLFRGSVSHAAQHDMSASVIEAEVLHGVQNDEVGVGENDVGVAVHYLYKEIKRRVIAHFGARVEAQEHYPVTTPHPDLFQHAHRKIFAQQHAKSRGGDGVWICAPR